MTMPVSALGLRSLATSMAGVGGRQAAAALIHLGTIVIIARVFGPEGNGNLALAWLLPGLLATFLNAGVAPANIYYLGSGRVSATTVVRSSLWLAGVLGTSGVVSGALTLGWWADSLFPGVPSTMLWIGLLAFPAILLQGYLSSVFHGLQRFRELNALLLANPFLLLTMVLGLLVSGTETLPRVVVAYTTAAYLTLGLTILALRRVPGGGDAPLDGPGYTRHAASYGLRAHLSNILAFVNYKADIFLVNLILNPAATGLYVVAVGIGEKLWSLSSAAATVLLPRLSAMREQEDERQSLTPLVTRWVLLISLLGASGLALLAGLVVPLVFGREFLPSVGPLLWLLPGIVAFGACRILTSDLAARGRPELNFYASAAVLVLNVIGNLLLIPLMGVSGAALATSVAYTAHFTITIWNYRRITGSDLLPLLAVGREDVERLRRLWPGAR
jgi:O-antigen/teichoic acid export membrane protein